MKKLILVTLMFPLLISAQYINIGSSKKEVRAILGEPTSVSTLDAVNQEWWSYDGASITFKNGKIKEYSNYNNVLPIGDISQNIKVPKEAKNKKGEPSYMNSIRKARRDRLKRLATAPKNLWGGIGSSYGGADINYESFEEKKRMKKSHEKIEEEKRLNIIYLVLAGAVVLFFLYVVSKRLNILNK